MAKSTRPTLSAADPPVETTRATGIEHPPIASEVALLAVGQRGKNSGCVQRRAKHRKMEREAPASLARGLRDTEQEVVDAALAILTLRAREPGALIHSAGIAHELVRLHLAQCDRERFAVLFLDSQHAVIAFEVLFEGSLTQCTVYPRQIARRALQLNAAAVILAHNHPNGKAEPSTADERLTATLTQALALVEVIVLDHLVIGWPDIVSFAERGLMYGGPRNCAPLPAAKRAGRRLSRSVVQQPAVALAPRTIAKRTEDLHAPATRRTKCLISGQFRRPMGWWLRACQYELRPSACDAAGVFPTRAERCK